MTDMMWVPSGSFLMGSEEFYPEEGPVRSAAVEGITAHDLNEALRLQAETSDPKRIRRATMERNGSISVIPYDREPQIIQVSVEDGVQNIRIKLE